MKSEPWFFAEYFQDFLQRTQYDEILHIKIILLFKYRLLNACYTGTSPMAITECCDWETNVPWASMKCYPGTSSMAITDGMLWLKDSCSMDIDEWSTTPALVLWPLLNVVTWRQMFHGHRWIKCYQGTSSMAITEWCDLKTDVPRASMNEVLPRD
jgi:hypothetical protein